jgi:hypothetical protein
VARFLDHAIAFAKTVLRANATTDFRECIGCLTELIGFPKAPFRRQAQPIGDIVVQRAMGLAIRNATLAAPTGLFGGFGACIFRINFIEIMRTQIRRALLRGFFFDGYKFKHLLLGHGLPPYLNYASIKGSNGNKVRDADLNAGLANFFVLSDRSSGFFRAAMVTYELN